MALNIAAEYMLINFELQLFRCISGTNLGGKIERSVYNKRRRKPFPYIEKIRKVINGKFSDFTDVFVMGFTPITICKINRANRSVTCSTDKIKSSFGYSAAQKSRYFEYRLHVACDKNGILYSFDFSQANVHDMNYLNGQGKNIISMHT